MRFIKKCFNKFQILFKFAINDLKKRYAGSIAGILWAYVLPLVTILVFWFVFELGFRQSPVNGTSFILWFVPAYIAWTYANDTILQSSNVLFEYSFLVKKVKFRVEMLPLIKVLSALLIHLFFILFCFVLNFIYKTPFNLIWFQVFYYTFALTIFLVGISWIASSLTVFWKDFGQITNVLLQVGFWATPVFWDPSGMNDNVLKVLKFNPLYYIVEGYRSCFVETSTSGYYPFWAQYKQMIYFWGVTLIIFVIGYFSFKKLSKHYADLL